MNPRKEGYVTYKLTSHSIQPYNLIVRGVANLDLQGRYAHEIKFYSVHIFYGKLPFFVYDLGF